MYKITAKENLAPNITRFSVEAPEVARSRKPGQFVVIRAEETSERVPLTIVDSDPEKGICILFSPSLRKLTLDLIKDRELNINGKTSATDKCVLLK